MKKPIKFFALFMTLMFFAVCFSVKAYAAENTLGDESPYLYGVYYNENDEQVDGNALTSGDYTVDIMLEGMSDISVFQYTAEYDPSSVITVHSTEAVITDDYPTLSLGGIKTADAGSGKERVVLALASTEENCTALDQGNAVTVASMSVTVTSESPIDFQDYFDFVTDPDLTFAEADYRDDIEDAYVLDISVTTTYATYEMTADITPENELDFITVSGKILIATDATGTASEFGLRGVKVYAYDNENNVIEETVSNATGESSTWGEYSLEVPKGTTLFMVGDYNDDSIVNREFTIAGDADVTGADVAVVMCDYNDDGFVNVIDKAVFNSAMKNEYNIYADFNDDTFVNVIDKGVFNSIMKNGGSNGIVYSEALYFESLS